MQRLILAGKIGQITTTYEAMYGAKYIGTLTGDSSRPAFKEYVVTNGETVTRGDFVNLASGYIETADITEEILGVAEETVTGDGTETCMVNVEPDALYLVDNDNDGTTFAVTHPGTYFDVTGTTGIQQIDTSTTGADGQVFCHEYNPQIAPYASDTSIGVFQIAEKQGFKSQ